MGVTIYTYGEGRWNIAHRKVSLQKHCSYLMRPSPNYYGVLFVEVLSLCWCVMLLMVCAVTDSDKAAAVVVLSVFRRIWLSNLRQRQQRGKTELLISFDIRVVACLCNINGSYSFVKERWRHDVRLAPDGDSEVQNRAMSTLISITSITVIRNRKRFTVIVSGANKNIL